MSADVAMNPRVCVAYAPSLRRAPYFSPEECDAVIRWSEEQKFETQETSAAGSPAVQRRHRHLDVRNPIGDARISWFIDRLEGLLFALNEQVWRFELTGATGLLIAKYEPGDQVAWHADLSSVRPDRKLVMLTQLSPPGAYSGGRLEYGVEAAVTASNEQGAVVAFPAWTPHRVTPVLSGIRYAAVSFALGPSFR